MISLLENIPKALLTAPFPLIFHSVLNCRRLEAWKLYASPDSLARWLRFGSANREHCQEIERQEEKEATVFFLLLLLAASTEAVGRCGLQGFCPGSTAPLVITGW